MEYKELKDGQLEKKKKKKKKKKKTLLLVFSSYIWYTFATNKDLFLVIFLNSFLLQLSVCVWGGGGGGGGGL